MNDQLKFLRTAAEGHSIEEVVFELNLAPSARIAAPDRYKDAFYPDLENELPKFEKIQALIAEINSQGVTERLPEEVGFTFEGYSSGALKYRLHGRNQPPGQGAWIAVNLLAYTRWDEMAAKAIGWMQLVNRVQSDLLVAGVTLNYIDRFYWDSDTPFPVSEIFEFENSEYLPSKLKEDCEDWNNQLSYSKRVEGGKQINCLTIGLERDQHRGFSRVTLSTPLRMLFDDHITCKELFAGNSVKSTFDELHRENKVILRDVLKPEIQELIQLNKHGEEDE